LSAQCEVLSVSVNGYRAWKRRGAPERKRLTDTQLLTLIRSSHAEFKGAYGSRKFMKLVRGHYLYPRCIDVTGRVVDDFLDAAPKHREGDLVGRRRTNHRQALGHELLPAQHIVFTEYRMAVRFATELVERLTQSLRTHAEIFSPRSMVATVTFLAAGITTTYVIRHVLGFQ
jgi:hypothetical protein